MVIISAVNAPGPRPIGAPQNHELLYSLAGSQIRAFKGGTLCLQNQVRRTIIRPNTGGSILGCDATMSFDMNEFAQIGPGNPDPGLKVPGNQVWVQFWRMLTGLARRCSTGSRNQASPLRKCIEALTAV